MIRKVVWVALAALGVAHASVSGFPRAEHREGIQDRTAAEPVVEGERNGFFSPYCARCSRDLKDEYIYGTCGKCGYIYCGSCLSSHRPCN